ncbi:hypothetical protein GCM10008927_19270 [Amylibacter ulvae]|uniref:Uncharacterized protein n=1 Tax=Paramylibacter ulvae TaxID=1651968 RepID=A0ABQ3D1F0_9RHOB|nr:hypothetical protein GCM10008927_19270 [Amylibacter ulvae]
MMANVRRRSISGGKTNELSARSNMRLRIDKVYRKGKKTLCDICRTNGGQVYGMRGVFWQMLSFGYLKHLEGCGGVRNGAFACKLSVAA